MSHQIETAAFARKPAWHGLGTVTEDAMNSADALRLSGLDWKVIQKRIQVAGGGLIDNWVANVRSSDQKPLGVVKASYKPVDPEKAFDFTDALVNFDAKYVAAGSLFGGSVIWMSVELPPKDIIGTEIVPFLFFTTSFDYRIPNTAALSATCPVCWNTLSYAIKNATRKWTSSHRSGIEGKVQEAQKILGISSVFMGRFEEDAKKLHARIMSRIEIQNLVDDIFPIDDEMTSRQKDNVDFLRQQFWEAFQQPDLGSYSRFGSPTAWTVMQAAADMASHLKPLRETATFKERNFFSLMNGNKILQNFHDRLEVIAN